MANLRDLRLQFQNEGKSARGEDDHDVFARGIAKRTYNEATGVWEEEVVFDPVTGTIFAGTFTASQIIDASANGRSMLTAAGYSAMRILLGLGTIATQDANNVAITGGAITGTTISDINFTGSAANVILGDTSSITLGVSASISITEGADLDLDADLTVNHPIVLDTDDGGERTLNIGAGGALKSGAFTIISGGTPASAGAAGVAGTIQWDSSFLYVCIATNTWKRVAIATW